VTTSIALDNEKKFHAMVKRNALPLLNFYPSTSKSQLISCNSKFTYGGASPSEIFSHRKLPLITCNKSSLPHLIMHTPWHMNTQSHLITHWE